MHCEACKCRRELHRLVDLLYGEGITVIPFKGPVLAEEAYGDIALRSFVDLDVLVPPEQAQDAVQVLLAQGYRLEFELPQDRWVGLLKVEYHVSLHHPEHDWIVEIHWALSHPMYMQSFDPSPHWQNIEGGREGRLKPEETLVMLCAHGTKHFWEQLKWLVDIDRILRNGPPINGENTLTLACRSSSVRSLLLGLNLSQSLLGTPLCAEFTARIDGSKVVRSLTHVAIANLFRQNPERKIHKNEYAFYLQSRDTLSDQLRQIFRWLFLPRLADWQVFPLGDYCHALYYVERPARMAWKWLLRPLFPGLCDKKSM